jgi:hypothetical protein
MTLTSRLVEVMIASFVFLEGQRGLAMTPSLALGKKGMIVVYEAAVVRHTVLAAPYTKAYDTRITCACKKNLNSGT